MSLSLPARAAVKSKAHAESMTCDADVRRSFEAFDRESGGDVQPEEGTPECIQAQPTCDVSFEKGDSSSAASLNNNHKDLCYGASQVLMLSDVAAHHPDYPGKILDALKLSLGLRVQYPRSLACVKFGVQQWHGASNHGRSCA